MAAVRDFLHGFVHSNRWLWRNSRALARHLRDAHGIVALVPMNRTRWHRGSRYFSATDRTGRRLFVKTVENALLLTNEAGAWARLGSLPGASAHFVPVRQHALAGPFPFAAFEWVEARPLAGLPAPLPAADADFIAAELAQILDHLDQAGLVHRDITPDNLLVRREGGRISRVLLIDFAHAACQGVAPADETLPALDLEHLGYGFKPGPLRWDDAFSCRAILEKLPTPVSAAGREAFAAINRRVGRNAFSRPAPTPSA